MPDGSKAQDECVRSSLHSHVSGVRSGNPAASFLGDRCAGAEQTSPRIEGRDVGGLIAGARSRPAGSASRIDGLLASFPRSSWLNTSAYFGVKRALDLGIVVLTTPIWLPALALLWLAIKLAAPSEPAFFLQERHGYRGRVFRMIKFRTMIAGAHRMLGQVRALSEREGPDIKIVNDPRVTPIGRLLRNYHLDELPQLINVLRGDMSLVGPRPTSYGLGTFADWHLARFDAPPGLTGLWQVAQYEFDRFDEHMLLDIIYVQQASLWLDLELLALTPAAILNHGRSRQVARIAELQNAEG